MKVIQKILLTFAMVLGLSFAAFAQKESPKPPPKEKPPVVTPQPKNPPPKKPGEALAIWKEKTSETA